MALISKSHLTYANVASTIALVVAVGGGGAATAAAVHLSNNSVGSKQVINNSLTSADVKNHSLRQQDFTAGKVGLIRGYAWNNIDNGTLNVPTKLTNAYTFNSAGGAVRVDRTAVGAYSVSFTHLNFGPGQVQVTAYGEDDVMCKTSEWSNSTVYVLCYDAAGALANAEFNVAAIN